MVFLSENKLHSKSASSLNVASGFGNAFFVDSAGKSEGLGLLWKDEEDISIISYSLEHIDANFQLLNESCWRFSGFYGNPVPSLRHHPLIVRGMRRKLVARLCQLRKSSISTD